jgi:dolichol kinase
MSKLNIFELRRELFHILVGISFLLVVLFFPYAEVFLFIVLIIGSLVSFLASQFPIPLITRALCLFERECNRKFLGKGVIFFFIGSLISLQLFQRNIALASIMILTFSDPISHFVGSNFGKRASSFDRKKNIEGTVAGIIVGFIMASFFISPLLAFTGSFFAMMLELAGIRMAGEKVDDNLLIPIVSGTIIYLLTLII